MWTQENAIANGGERAREIIQTLLGREIQITKQMIRDGCRNDCTLCPAALAILAVMPGCEVYADYWMIQVDRCVRFSVPENLERFMRRFDSSRRESITGLRFVLDDAKLVIAAWGKVPWAQRRIDGVFEIFQRQYADDGKRWECLGFCKSAKTDLHAWPRHPLYVRAVQKPVVF